MCEYATKIFSYACLLHTKFVLNQPRFLFERATNILPVVISLATQYTNGWKENSKITTTQPDKVLTALSLAYDDLLVRNVLHTSLSSGVRGPECEHSM